MKLIDENGNKNHYIPGGLLKSSCNCTSETPKEDLCESCKVKGIPLHRRSARHVDSFRKMNAAIKKDKGFKW